MKRLAKPGHLWVCGACGRTTEDRTCFPNESTPRGWDESCMLNSVEIEEKRIKRGEYGFVVGVD